MEGDRTGTAGLVEVKVGTVLIWGIVTFVLDDSVTTIDKQQTFIPKYMYLRSKQ